MRKSILFILFLVLSNTATSTVVSYLPYYFVLNYSVKGGYMYEIPKNSRISYTIFGGIGPVNTFLVTDEPPALGLKTMIERRFYLKKNKFNGLSLSSSLGLEFISNEEFEQNLTLIPSLKINYKLPDSRVLVEPYLGLSVPVPFNITDKEFYYTFPLATLGLKVGLQRIKTEK